MGHVLEFSLERSTSLQLQVTDRSLAIVSAYEPNSTQPSWRPWEEYWNVLQLGIPSFSWESSMLSYSSSRIIYRGVTCRNSLPHLIPSAVLLLDFRAIHSHQSQSYSIPIPAK